MDEPGKMHTAAKEPSQHWAKTKNNNRPKAKFGGRSRDTQISMALSSLLRHQASNVGITLDGEGFAPLDQVLKWGRLSSLSPTVSDIRRVVVNCEKQRFEMRPNPAVDPAPCRDSNEDKDEDPCHFLIRANQGHSIAVKSDSIFAELDASTLPPRVLHGTFFWAWPRIVESGGLKRMGRQHIHCATGMTEDNVVGMRRDAELVIEIDAEKALEDGIRWFRSKNGYVLTEGDDEGMVPLRYFKQARGRLKNVGVLVKDGEIVAGLPAGLKACPPFGKATGGFRYAGGKGGKGKGRTQ